MKPTSARFLSVGKLLMLATYTYYVLSNATVLHDDAPQVIKHGLFIAMALVSLLAYPGRAVVSLLVALPIALIYFLGGLTLFGCMVLALGAAVPVMSIVLLDLLEHRRWRSLCVLGAISLVPAVIGVDIILANGLLDSTYGRERLLLGYFHPKEAGICFGIPILLALMMSGRRLLPFALAATLFIVLVGSRNVALTVALAALIRRFPYLVLMALLTSFVSVAIWLALDPELWEALNTLASLRLSVWEDALSDPSRVVGLDVLDGERFAVDNFFIEAYVFAGWAAIGLVLAWGFSVGWIVARAPSRWPMVSFCILLVFASFDSGIASTGNLMHGFLWALMLYPLACRRGTAAPATSTGADVAAPR
ncbi:hypothetical protein DBR42_17940, partial [Pelomonas sp. HMWF004]